MRANGLPAFELHRHVQAMLPCLIQHRPVLDLILAALGGQRRKHRPEAVAASQEGVDAPGFVGQGAQGLRVRALLSAIGPNIDRDQLDARALSTLNERVDRDRLVIVRQAVRREDDDAAHARPGRGVAGDIDRAGQQGDMVGRAGKICGVAIEGIDDRPASVRMDEKLLLRGDQADVVEVGLQAAFGLSEVVDSQPQVIEARVAKDVSRLKGGADVEGEHRLHTESHRTHSGGRHGVAVFRQRKGVLVEAADWDAVCAGHRHISEHAREVVGVNGGYRSHGRAGSFRLGSLPGQATEERQCKQGAEQPRSHTPPF